MKVNLLGVKIDDVTEIEALSKIEKWIWNPGKHMVVTPNPEFLMAAQHDEIFRKILNEADLAIPDGVGLKLSGKVKNTVYGTDLMEKLIAKSAEKGFVIGLLGGRKGIALKLKDCLEKQYQTISVGFVSNGGKIDINGKTTDDNAPKIPPLDILFVAFGHIKQEKWIKNNLDRIPVKIAMGVGGAFDYLSGSTPRAPKIIRKLGFEWLFRLIIEPWRFKRQLSLLKYLYLIVIH